MGLTLVIGSVFTAWAVLRTLGGERARRLTELEAGAAATAAATAEAPAGPSPPRPGASKPGAKQTQR